MLPSPSESLFLPFVKREQLTSDAYSFFFDKTKHPFSFLPGQTARITLEIPNPDERGRSHMFSIASSPLDDYLMFTMRVIQSSFKKHMLTLQTGEEVKFFAPIGQFTIDEQDMTPHVFLAGGIGVTPFHSMMRYASQTNSKMNITLLVTFSTTEAIIFANEFTEIEKRFPNLKTIISVTRPEESQTPWSGEIGRISPEMIKKYVPEINNAKYFISGPPLMVDGMYEMLNQMQIPQEKIRKEKFTGY